MTSDKTATPSNSENDFHAFEQIMSQVEKALLQNDINTALKILEDIEQSDALQGETLAAVRRRVRVAAESYEQVNRLYETGERALSKGEPDQALTCFNTILELCPDHTEARAGVQNANRFKDLQEKISTLLIRARKAGDSEDYLTAKEICKSILALSPDDEVVQELYSNVSERVEKNRQIMRVIRLGDQCFEEEKYEEAIRTWENVRDIDAASDRGEKRIEDARKQIEIRKSKKAEEALFLEAQRAFDNGHYQSVERLLKDFPPESEYHIEVDLCLRKARDGLERKHLAQNLEAQILNHLFNGDLESAGDLIGVLLDLNPESDVIDEYHKALDDASTSET
jgi:tetratricopeptide (TPR) repeat protein